MRMSRSPLRLRFSTGYALVTGALVPVLVFLFLDTRHQRWAIAVVAAAAALALVTFRGRRRWVFPADECAVLPLANTTAEWIARWIGLSVAESLVASGHAPLRSIRVSVDECLGQSGVWERG